MNVIISNKFTPMLDSLSIDVIKKLEGEFEADDIINQFKNFFFQRMILDITAIKDYKNIQNLQKLSISLDMDKVILLLDDNDESNSNLYLSKLISMGIYNFTKNVEGIMYLYNNPNSYRDVAHIQQLDILGGAAPVQQAQASTVNNKVIPTVNNNVFVNPEFEETMAKTQRVIGIKNVTKQSGATTLAYMLKNQLMHNYSVVAIEVDKTDFKYFNDKSLISTTSENVKNVISNNSDNDVIIIDLNNSSRAEDFCTEIYYLIEPSIIKLNKLLFVDRSGNSIKALKNKKVILNQSLLNSKDVLDFETEAGFKIFYNMPPLDERERSIHALNRFLVTIGFTRQGEFEEQERKKNKILGLFGI